MKCSSCGKTSDNLRRCSACKTEYYCDSKCQRDDRLEHKSECKRLAEAMKKADQTGKFQLLVLTKEERKREFDRMCDDDSWIKDLAEEEYSSEESDSLYPSPLMMNKKQPKYKWEEYDTVEEALECYVDSSQEELKEYRKKYEEEQYWWQIVEGGYRSLEHACMDCYQAKSVEEAVWDTVAVPRIKLIWPEDATQKQMIAMMQREGWKGLGYKPWEINMNENTMAPGRRVVGGCGFGWEESGRR